MDPEHARRELIRGLQLAYSGELGAIRAYLGHRLAVSKPDERNGITRILKDEIRHRRLVLTMLEQVGSGPDPWAEKKIGFVGRCIAFICFVTGWYVPVYGAARLENNNIVEYEILARLAWHAGLRRWVDDLLHLAEVEWDHEEQLRGWAASHWLWRISPRWRPPPPRDQIRTSFEAWTRSPGTVDRPRAWIVR
jgi:hypothetical protein